MTINQLQSSVVKKNPYVGNVCDLGYIIEVLGDKRHLIKEIMDAFILGIPQELKCINEAVTGIDYPVIKNVAHSMKSSVSIMGISLLAPVLKEMDELGALAINIERIEQLNQNLNLICKKAVEEIEEERNNYS